MRHIELTNLPKSAVTAGVEKALEESGTLPTHLAKREAYRLYGRSDVDRWISEKLLPVTTDLARNNKKLIERKQLEAVAASSNRITYLPVVNRKV